MDTFVQWAESQEDIRLVFVLGSRARRDHPADEWSDLDLAVCARNIRPYLEQDDWIRMIGKPWLTFLEATGDGRSLERRVLFEGGLDVDFALIPMELILGLGQGSVPEDIADLFHRGVRVLLDKDHRLPEPERLAIAWQPPPLPQTSEFLEVVNDFWYHSLWTAKHLRRGELWWAKSGCDEHLKHLLRRMLEWQARLLQGPDHDPWLRGRFLEEWVDPRALPALKDTFAHYDAADIWRALFATMDVFDWVSLETAQKLGVALPKEEIGQTVRLVRSLSLRPEA